MTKYAILVASALAFVGCQSDGDRVDRGQASSVTGASGPDDYYGRASSPVHRTDTGSVVGPSIDSTAGSVASGSDPGYTAQGTPGAAVSGSGTTSSPILPSQTAQPGSSPAQSGVLATPSSEQSGTQTEPITTGTQDADNSIRGNEDLSSQPALEQPTADAGTTSPSSQVGPPREESTIATPPANPPGAPSIATPAPAPALSAGANAADDAITLSVTNSLAAMGIPPATLENVHVRTMNGRVILSGQVSSLAEKQQIETQTRRTPGVRTIINQIRVNPGDE